MQEVTPDWAGAEVGDTKLTVAVEGDPPNGWRQSFLEGVMQPAEDPDAEMTEWFRSFDGG